MTLFVNLIRRLFWGMFEFVVSILLGDRIWAMLRLVVSIGLLWLFIHLGIWWFEPAELANSNWLEPRRIRYLILPLAAFVIAVLVGSHYVRDIYELPDFRLGFRYLFASLFGFGYPRLTIDQGRPVIDPEQVNLLDAIGGPGTVNIRLGNAALFERLYRPADVYAGGSQFIARHETIREAVSLQPQTGTIEAINVVTQDGIEIAIREITYIYRIRADRTLGTYRQRQPDEPYPYSVRSLWRAAYNRTVAEGGVGDWHAAVRGQVTGLLTEYISERSFNDLAAPGFANIAAFARRELDEMLHPRVRRDQNAAERDRSQSVRNRFRNLGVELIRVEIGHLDPVDPEVQQQILETWRADWAGRARVPAARAEGYRLAQQELARQQHQATLIVELFASLRNLGAPEFRPEALRRLIILRSAQIIDNLRELPPPDNGQGDAP